MTERPATPGELRAEAHAVLARLRRLDRADRTGGRLTTADVEEVGRALAELQGRIETTAGHYAHAWALPDVLAARRHLDDARTIVLTVLARRRVGP